ncbi:hypothetical protein CPJCM30710_15100 [Clostridium polyendosporum]|uniref:Uncharacterized protein n=1 Tax=Clostridium polyendosporum TaxID=69208 RepID=A0A919VE75_9CLOT|nr:hypothetical protein [Clostridium polyendosporum]GIM28844.1 hypothetical protein CPJCM30710_15100 [Clostridium polyendosporum]
MSYKVLITKEINNAGEEFLKENGYEIKMLSDILKETIIVDNDVLVNALIKENKDEFDCISVLSV